VSSLEPLLVFNPECLDGDSEVPRPWFLAGEGGMTTLKEGRSSYLIWWEAGVGESVLRGLIDREPALEISEFSSDLRFRESNGGFLVKRESKSMVCCACFSAKKVSRDWRALPRSKTTTWCRHQTAAGPDYQVPIDGKPGQFLIQKHMQIIA